MSAVIRCPICSQALRLPTELKGQKVQCPSCKETFDPITTVEPLPEDVSEPAERPDTNLTAAGAQSPSSPATRKEDRGHGEALLPCPHCGEAISETTLRCPFCGGALDDEDEQPWERPGAAVRRDREPHRGSIVLTLGILSIVAFLMMFACSPICLAGLTLGIMAWVMGQRDLKKIAAKVMDPEGQTSTSSGRVCGIVGTCLNALGVLLAIVMLAFLGFMMTTTRRARQMQPPPPPPKIQLNRTLPCLTWYFPGIWRNGTERLSVLP